MALPAKRVLPASGPSPGEEEDDSSPDLMDLPDDVETEDPADPASSGKGSQPASSKWARPLKSSASTSTKDEDEEDDKDDEEIPRRRTRPRAEEEEKGKKETKSIPEIILSNGEFWKAGCGVISTAIFLIAFWIFWGMYMENAPQAPDLAFQQEAVSQGKLMDELVDEYRAAKDDAARMLVKAKAKEFPELTPIFEKIDETRVAAEAEEEAKARASEAKASAEEAARIAAMPTEANLREAALKSREASKWLGLAGEIYPWQILVQLSSGQAEVVGNVIETGPAISWEKELEGIRLLHRLLTHESTVRSAKAGGLALNLELIDISKEAGMKNFVKLFRRVQKVAILDYESRLLTGKKTEIFYEDGEGYRVEIDLAPAISDSSPTAPYLEKLKEELNAQPRLL